MLTHQTSASRFSLASKRAWRHIAALTVLALIVFLCFTGFGGNPNHRKLGMIGNWAIGSFEHHQSSQKMILAPFNLLERAITKSKKGEHDDEEFEMILRNFQQTVM